MSEAIKQEELIGYKDKPTTYSLTTTEINMTGSWRFIRPEVEDNIAPCSDRCPGSINMARYMQYIGKGDNDTAVKILREENPMPAITGRVCPAFCETECNRKEFDEQVAIRQVERFLGDWSLDHPESPPTITSDKKIAVVGSGPSGLSCAYFLAKAGYDVTIYEGNDEVGGVLTYGIPLYRLPSDVRKKELGLIIRGINVKTGIYINETSIYKLANDYDALFFAPGLWKDKIILKGSGVYAGGELLKSLAAGKKPPSGKKAVVVGSGNVAMDAARSLMRLGKDITVVCAETAEQVPAFKEEFEQAIEENLQIKQCELPISLIYGNSKKLKGIKMSKAAIVDKKVVTEKTVLEIIDADMLIYAIGQDAEFRIKDKKNIFVGGDYLTGPSSVIDSISSGKAASFQIEQFLKTGTNFQVDKNSFRLGNPSGRNIISYDKINGFYFAKKKRMEASILEVKQRGRDSEIIGACSEDEAAEEASRCFHCGSCDFCQTCWFYCPDVAIKTINGTISFDYDHCKGCGTCFTECPRGAIAMKEEL